MRRDVMAGGSTLTVGELREAIADLDDGARVLVHDQWTVELESVSAADLEVVLVVGP